MTPTILEQRILDLTKREPGARPARVNAWTSQGRCIDGSDDTRFIPQHTRAVLVHKLRRQGKLKPHDPERPGLYLQETT